MPSSEPLLADPAAIQPWTPADFNAPAAPRAPAGVPVDTEPALILPTAADIERIHNEAHKNGYAAGYEEGTARVRMEAMRLHSLFEQLDQALTALDQSVAADLQDLAVEIARQVIRRELATAPELIVEVARQALQQLPHQHAVIYLHPEDVALVRTALGEQMSHAGQRVQEDPQIERGGCQVESSGSQIDATNQTRWRRVLEGLGRNDPWQPEPK